MNKTEEMFRNACEVYREYGVDAVQAVKAMDAFPITLNAWQGDDVQGFENTGHSLTGGCQVTGSYPGCARNSAELRDDLDFAMKLLPGPHKVGLQGHEVDRMFPGRDRDAFDIDNFSDWAAWGADRKIGLDMAPAFYSHPKLDHGLSLSHPDKAIRDFWIGHGQAMRRVAAAFAKSTGQKSVCNFWAPDGFKDTPADRLSPRRRLAESLDAIFAEAVDDNQVLDAVESKLFGIGTESSTVGSHDFYLRYAALRDKAICLDMGHFHPTESVAEKLSAIVALQGKILLHVSRGVRWDSDHVIVLNDELQFLAREIVRCFGGDNIFIALDFFDASINRTAAWITGSLAMRKALMIALLEPRTIDDAEIEWNFTARLLRQEEAKSLPWAAVWQYYRELHGIPSDTQILGAIGEYERKTLFKRG
ncbi:MAG: L-rhamnose isomerase [Victivallaceae bacterium]|nr:L-rhamnose isomerase [Victivallaceae bacterium]